MGGIVDSVVDIGSFGIIDDFSGAKAAGAAATEAGRIQAAAASEAEAGINRRFDISQENLRPAMEAGNQARSQQLALLGLSGDAAQTNAVNNISESPAQKWIRERGQKNLLQNAAAIGGIGGGNVRSALVEQGTGFALQDTNNQFARLAGLSGAGNSATNTSVNAGANAANAAGQAIIQGGQAEAGGVMGVAQANANATNQAYQLAGLAAAPFTGGASIPLSGVAGSMQQPDMAMRQPAQYNNNEVFV